MVATDCPSGPREIVKAGVTGALVGVGDSAAMAEAIGVWLDRTVPASVFEDAVAPYRIDASAGAYLKELGLDSPVSGRAN